MSEGSKKQLTDEEKAFWDGLKEVAKKALVVGLVGALALAFGGAVFFFFIATAIAFFTGRSWFALLYLVIMLLSGVGCLVFIEITDYILSSFYSD